MKKIIPLLLILIFFTSCYSNSKDLEKIKELESKISIIENEKDLEKNILCGEKKSEYIKEYEKDFGDKRTFGDSWFSPILNTCILESTYYSLEEVMGESDNYNAKFFSDTLEKKVIGSIAYYESFGFEGGVSLPNNCDLDFTVWEKSGEEIFLNLPLVVMGDVGQTIYNSEFMFENCKRFLKGINNSIDIKIRDLDFKYDKNAFNHIRFN